ncbi:GFA family protein [Alteromonas sp. ASW11-130]|uniref:GFA family protein n=1 Tax=Alteromonas sp. ASW11-130 TaxID=3015775 RepID=UPI002242384F|nr:GFA family protein [Alteromonas sp. ASW11-130]MCW8090945.1 GFA family protein [Alteromonas sp. ASW11-130]
MMKTYHGGCHCKRVQFDVTCEQKVDVDACNCSICQKTGFLHLIVPINQFKLNTSWDNLNCYTFNTHVAKHYFCNYCGIKSFYIPRSNPNGISVNARCLEGEPPEFAISEFNGQEWEKHAHKLAHKA